MFLRFTNGTLLALLASLTLTRAVRPYVALAGVDVRSTSHFSLGTDRAQPVESGSRSPLAPAWIPSPGGWTTRPEV